MTRLTSATRRVSIAWALALLGGCACAPEEGAGLDASGLDRDGGPPSGMDGSAADAGSVRAMDAAAADDAAVDDDAFPGDSGWTESEGAPEVDASSSDAEVTATMDAALAADAGASTADGGPVPCVPATCGGRTYSCGNCLDDDGDGLVDAADPGCIGPCDQTEDIYDLGIPGGDTAACQRDCYYDEDQGSGNDRCAYDERCDPLSPDPLCPATPPGGPVRCPPTQPAECYANCLPVTPNGCDCFGCCELPARSGRHVFLGSTDADGNHTCTPDALGDPSRCAPCTPYAGCNNVCERCELCLGATSLPPECLAPPPVDAGTAADAGAPADGGALVDAGRPVDAGTADAGAADAGRALDAGPVDAGLSRCPSGGQACGLPGDSPCPASYYCLTGCCVFFG